MYTWQFLFPHVTPTVHRCICAHPGAGACLTEILGVMCAVKNTTDQVRMSSQLEKNMHDVHNKKMNAWILLRAPANYWKGKRYSNDPRKQAKEMHRKFIGNVLQVASKHRQMLRISEIRAASKDHILWLDDHLPLPLWTKHILFSEMKLGTEDENMSTDNQKLYSVELWVFCTYQLSGHKTWGANTTPWQWVLRVLPLLRAGGSRGLSQAHLPPWERGQRSLQRVLVKGVPPSGRLQAGSFWKAPSLSRIDLCTSPWMIKLEKSCSRFYESA